MQQKKAFGLGLMGRGGPLKTGCSASLHCSRNSIGGPFAMGCSKKVPLSQNSKVFFMEQKIDEVVTVFVLSGTTIRVVIDFLQLRMGFFQQWNQSFEESVNHSS